jgi:hypothetical protein
MTEEEKAQKTQAILWSLYYGFGPSDEELSGADWIDFCGSYIIPKVLEVLDVTLPEYEGDDPDYDAERAARWGY